MESTVEKEQLYALPNPKQTAFSPRPLEKFVTAKAPVSDLKIECTNWYRQQANESHVVKPGMNYRLWMEAGKFYHSDKPDSTISLQDVDWSVWRNYGHLYGYCNENEPVSQKGNRKSISADEAAQLFPISIPKPSVLNKNTLGKYLQDNPKFIKNERQRKLVIISTDTDVEEFRRLRLKSELRNPPIDRRGKILPPPNFKKYRPIHLIGVTESDIGESPLTYDMFGQPVKQIHDHSRIFLSSRLNCPTYAKVFEKIKEAMEATRGRSGKLATLVSAPTNPKM